MNKRVDWVKRLWDKVDVKGWDECWEWNSSLAQTTGYGEFHLNGKTVSAHRLTYETAVGPIPYGLHVDHLCRNRACVNPRHLEPVTQSENLRRGWLVRKKDHCSKGHLFTPDNMYKKQFGRECRQCALNREKLRRIRQKEEKK